MYLVDPSYYFHKTISLYCSLRKSLIVCQFLYKKHHTFPYRISSINKHVILVLFITHSLIRFLKYGYNLVAVHGSYPTETTPIRNNL